MLPSDFDANLTVGSTWVGKYKNKILAAHTHSPRNGRHIYNFSLKSDTSTLSNHNFVHF